MDRIKEKMNSLRLEADESAAKVEELQARVKTLEQENLAKEQEITSLQHKNGLLEGEVEKLETAVKDFKKAADESAGTGTQNETLQRRLQLLEEEAEEADKTLREANEKYVLDPVIEPSKYFTPFSLVFNQPPTDPPFVLRQTDVKAGHFERKVQALESERDQWESKYEEMSKKYTQVQKELEDFQNEIGNI
ncbi:actin lateral binding protein [Colletotrichum asianum]|uniref:Actin lateral binding protein n=1 Tax=Colletotrichum asianum TaxID=702518 RepID=A0A8H3ZT31_9PEZI|nr:actin lateral binding protein [Colletotrichum asianum]